MVSKAKVKFIKSLQLKKYRKQAQSFLVEGAKSVQELLVSDYKTTMLLVTSQFLEKHEEIIQQHDMEVIVVTEKELATLGTFQHNNAAMAIGEMPPAVVPGISDNEFALALDDVRDPGNLGTIVRIADWYGIKKIIASPTTADIYNPKVLNASMGSFTRVQLGYTELFEFLEKTDLPVYGAFMNGKNIHEETFGTAGIVVMGNESNGISERLNDVITSKITIPRYGMAESLNVAIATAIICDNLKR